MYVAFAFDNPLIEKSIAKKTLVEVPDFYREQVYTCDHDFNYALGVSDWPNENHAWCYSIDANGTNIYHESDFNHGDLKSKTMYTKFLESGYSYYDLIGKTHHFSQATYQGQQFYYITNPVTFQAGETKEWFAKYKPQGNEGKWDLYAWTGDSWDCILDDSCTWKVHLDPWWNAHYSDRIDLNIANTDGFNYVADTNRTARLTLDTTDSVRFNDVNCLAIVYQDTKELDLNIANFGTTNTIIEFRFNNTLTSGTSNITDYKLYTNCDPIPSNPARNKQNIYSLYDDFSDGDFTNNPVWVPSGAGWSVSSGMLLIESDNITLWNADANNFDGNIGSFEANLWADHIPAGNDDVWVFLFQSDTVAGNTQHKQLAYLNNEGAADFALRRTLNGASIYIDQSTNDVGTDPHDIKWSRTSGGDWNITVDGSEWLSGNNIDIQDGNLTGIYVANNAGCNFDNVSIIYLTSETNTIGDWSSHFADVNQIYVAPIEGPLFKGGTYDINWQVLATENEQPIDTNIFLDIDTNYDNGISEYIIQDLNLWGGACTGDGNFANWEDCNYLWYNDTNLASGTYYIGIYTEDSYDNNVVYSPSIVIMSLILTINVPKDEWPTGDQNIVPYSVFIRGAISLDYNGQMSAIEDLFLSNDIDPYIITVQDDDANYYARTYVVYFTDLNEYTLQPYLLSKTDEVSTLTVKARTKMLDTLPGVLIEFYKTGYTEPMTSGITGSAGYTFYLRALDQYNIRAYYPRETLVYSEDNFTFTTTPMYIYVDLGTVIYIPEASGLFNVLFEPTISQIFSGITTMTQKMSWNANYDINYINILVTHKDINGIDFNLMYDSNSNVAGLTNLTNTITIANITSHANYDENYAIHVTVRVLDDTNAIAEQFSMQYWVSVPYPNFDFIGNIRNMRGTLGCTNDEGICPMGVFVSLFLTIIILGAIVWKTGLRDTLGITILGLGMLSLFTYVGLFDWMLWVLIALLGIMSYWGMRGIGERER